jgi:hypothetical protein
VIKTDRGFARTSSLPRALLNVGTSVAFKFRLILQDVDYDLLGSFLGLEWGAACLCNYCCLAIVGLAYALFRMAADGMCTDLQGC